MKKNLLFRPLAAVIVAALTVLTSSCSLFQKRAEPVRGDALVEVAGHFLYQSDVEEVIPPECSAADSLKIAERFIRRWATDALLYDRAIHNISDTREIDRMAEEYRKTLMIYAYEQQMVEQRMPKEVDDSVLQAFYGQYASRFPLTDNLLQGMILVVPLQAEETTKAKTWLTRRSEADMESLEKYAMRHAVYYELFDHRWTSATQVAAHLPLTADELASRLAKGPGMVELRDSLNLYLLQVTDCRLAGQEPPLEAARGEMQSILFDQRKIEFLQNFEDHLYEDALNDGLINRINH